MTEPKPDAPCSHCGTMLRFCRECGVRFPIKSAKGIYHNIHCRMRAAYRRRKAQAPISTPS